MSSYPQGHEDSALSFPAEGKIQGRVFLYLKDLLKLLQQ